MQVDQHRIEALIDVLGRMAAGELDARAEVSSGHDVLTTISEAVNHLAEEVQVANRVRHEAQRRLAANEARLAHVIATSPTTLYTCEAAEPYGATFISPNVAVQFGFQPMDFIGDPGFWASRIHPEDAPRIFAELGQIFEHGHHTHEYRWQAADGSWRWVYDQMRLSLDPDGNPVEMIGSWMDITTRRESERALEAGKDRAEAANRAKSAFLTNMSHELRTPLNAVIGFSELLETCHFGPLNQRQLHYVTTIAHSGKHLLDLISDLLDLSTIEAGRMKLMGEVSSVTHLIEEAVSTLQPAAEKQGVTLAWVPPRDDMAAWVDPTRIRQVAYNLISNSVKFTPRGGQVRVFLTRGTDVLHLHVADSGVGIPEEEYGRLFQPFERINESPEIGGAGLGLALSRELVQAHGGTISVDSQVGEGSTFTVTLPILPKVGVGSAVK